MHLEDLIILLVVGAIAGWGASLLIKKRSLSLPVNILVGIIGAGIGRYVFDFFHIHIRGFIGSVISATVGAILLLLVAKLVNRK